MIVHFSLPAVTLSQNKLDGKHWTVKHEQRQYWHQLVVLVCGKPDRDQLPSIKASKASVHILRVGKRLIDPLNVPAGCKWLLDALVNQGWLRGDSYEDVVIQTDQRKCEPGEEPHTVVTITY